MKRDSAVRHRDDVPNDVLLDLGRREVSWSERHKRAEGALNDAYRSFRDPESKLDRFVHNAQIQIRIFQYEAKCELAEILRNEPIGFAKVVAIKGLLHKIVEFNKHVHDALIPAMLEFSAKKGMEFTEDSAREVCKTWRPTLKVIRGWETIRNKATGHYDPDVERVVTLLENVDVEEVRRIHDEFTEFNLDLIGRFVEASTGKV